MKSLSQKQHEVFSIILGRARVVGAPIRVTDLPLLTLRSLDRRGLIKLNIENDGDRFAVINYDQA